jgi:hypothetical protein
VGEGVQGSSWDERAVGADRRRSQGYTLQIPRICTGAAAATIEGFSSFRPGFPTVVESPRFGRTKRQPLPARLDRVFRRCTVVRPLTAISCSQYCLAQPTLQRSGSVAPLGGVLKIASVSNSILSQPPAKTLFCGALGIGLVNRETNFNCTSMFRSACKRPLFAQLG